MEYIMHHIRSALYGDIFFYQYIQILFTAYQKLMTYFGTHQYWTNIRNALHGFNNIKFNSSGGNVLTIQITEISTEYFSDAQGRSIFINTTPYIALFLTTYNNLVDFDYIWNGCVPLLC